MFYVIPVAVFPNIMWSIYMYICTCTGTCIGIKQLANLLLILTHKNNLKERASCLKDAEAGKRQLVKAGNKG